ncbi:glutamyl-tRNA(Gln) amidotransferase subunit A, mitochondrial [Elysia marginata]|uniref:Glutamyl-tRNA(Gln) amidotransferase subunit A, mitochondrial n=1 Tax=Elysia marginata TaxID=1093978 RepID=A0AAV4JG47_9GAST|nr:glutamyl-tRNA(Gln) amidotransferase subunit A, mitochondrial [Elysia marginata]
MLQSYNPPYNATMVEKVIDAGGIIVGKANMDEFAMGSGSLDSCHGAVINPWNLLTFSCNQIQRSDWCIAGGSSGGSAAAVAAGACLAAFGSDTGGSTRNPASYCGIVGLKPTYGLLSRHGLIPLVNSMDVPGIMTKTIEDSVILLNAVAGHDIRDSTTVQESLTPFTLDHEIDLSKLHVGIPKEFHAPGLSEEVVEMWRATADHLEQAGAKVSQVYMPHTRHCLICYHVLCCCEVASNFSRYTGIEFGLRSGSEESTEELYAQNRHYGFNDVVRGRILAGNFFLLRKNFDRFFLKAQRIRRLISNDFKAVFDSGVHFLLTPTTLTDAPSFNWFCEKDNRSRCAEQDIFTTPANMAGIPAVSIPLRISRRGLPLSLQLMGPHFSESRLLSLAHWLEQQAGFPHLDLDFLDKQAIE